MNPSINSGRAATILDIPVSKIRRSPNNPRRVIPEASIETLAASLKEVGQKTPLKVIRVQDDPNVDYELVGGERRWLAAQKAGFETVNCLVLDLSPDQAFLEAVLDNDSEPMSWLDWVLAIERISNDPSDPTQRELGDKFGVTHTRIGNALKVAGALTPSSRDILGKQVANSGSDSAVAERTILALAGLGDPQLVEKALPVVLDRKMTEAQAKRLVDWVKAGNEPSTFGLTGVASSQPDPIGSAPRNDSKGRTSVPRPQAEGHALSVPISGKQEIGTEDHGGLASPATPVELPKLDPKQAGRNLLKWVWDEIRQAFINGLKGMGRKAITACVIFLVVVVVYAVLGWGSDLFYHLIRPQAYWDPASVTRPQAEGQALSAPISEKQEIGASAPTSVASVAPLADSPKESAQPKRVPQPEVSAQAKPDVVSQAANVVGQASDIKNGIDSLFK